MDTVTGHRSGRTWKYISGLLATLILVALMPGLSGTAHADAFRFWGYWQFQEGVWAFATKGAAQITPKDGEIEGWRYAISGDTTGERVPRAVVTFDQLCGTTPAEAGKKRVGVVIDFGTANEAPEGVTPPAARGACALVDPNATSAQVLAQVADVREEKGLYCAIDSFPASGCGDPVANEDVPEVPSPEPTVQLQVAEPPPATTEPTEPSEPTASDSPTSTDTSASDDSEPAGGSSFPVWPVVVVLIIVLLAAGGFWQYRRRTATDSPESPDSPDSSTD